MKQSKMMRWQFADIEFTKQKIGSVRSQIKHLRSSDFPYLEPKQALGLLDKVYQDDLGRMQDLSTASIDVRQSTCARANLNIARFKNVLGLILRSTNVRNAFEIYDPLLRLSRSLLGGESKLILSSEWMFSPFTYPASFKELPEFVFIGLPASESSNALVVPLAGHELGHSVWRNTNAKGEIDLLLQSYVETVYHNNWNRFEHLFGPADKTKLLTDLILRPKWVLSYRIAQRQIEEIFCDVLGVRLFGEGFLYSFLYLIAPNLGGLRSTVYPKLNTRAKFLVESAKEFKFDVPEKFEDFFTEKSKKLPEVDEYIVAMADEAVGNLFPRVVEAIKDYCNQKTIPVPSNESRDSIAQSLANISPIDDQRNLADIINAGWKLRLGLEAWDKYDVDENRKIEMLNDLIFKCIEVSEFEIRQSEV
jgi:hypothetical protein